MPSAPLRYCAFSGCSTKVTKGYCSTHSYDKQRGTRSQRGYDQAWVRWRADVLSTYSLVLCGDRPPDAPPTEDSYCQREGRLTPGDDLDHIQPIAGKEDARRLDTSNVQLLCDRWPNYCHSRKRGRERHLVTYERSTR